MPRKADKELGYLTVHDGLWRVSMGVPRELRDQLGSRLVKSTGTASKAQAKLIRDMVVPQFKKKIEDAWKARGGKRNTLLHIALEHRRLMEESDENLQCFMEQGARERIEEILNEGASYVDEHTPDGIVERRIPRPDAVQAVAEFKRVMRGDTPIAFHHEEFVKELKTKARSKLDEPRALGILLDWLESQDIEPYIENVNKRAALRFMKYMDAHSDLSWASKAKYFGRIKFYWSWLVRNEYAKENPFHDLGLERPETARADDERPYTDGELQKILMGKPLEGDKLLDVVKVAALTGARLDAVVDLQVGGLADGYFTFKPQKKERDERDVPVHPDLMEIVARRIKGKLPEDDFFPEWPAPPNTSVRARSAYFSKRYTKYTSDIGVRDERDDKRRSLTNFHSLRRWFITEMERARVREGLISAIVGHRRKGLTFGLYSDGPEFQEATEAIARIKLPPIDGTPVVERRALSPRRRRQS
ncbi:integrase [Methylobacterium sp. SI9]|uniref:tyrosine-type recombinase/integrase n=1 Tax=Methylobacterium guangdongense TaxID=3138811 RepID=UPI00313AC495